MKFRYIGEYPVGQTSGTFFGVVFAPGLAVEVPQQFVAKALYNRFFEVVEEVQAPEPQASEAVPPPTKEDLIAIAEANEIKIDKRWSYDRLAQAVINHSKELA